MRAKDSEIFAQDKTRWVGQRVPRREDPELLTGRGRYLGDL